MKNYNPSAISAMLCAAITTAMVPEIASGACLRGDVDYYLAHGFSHEQVVTLCTGKPVAKDHAADRPPETPGLEKTTGRSGSSRTTASDRKSKLFTPSENPQRDEAKGNDLEDFLRYAIDGYDVQLSDQALQYTRRTCIEYGPYNLFGIKTEACPDVRYTISRAGLSVESVKRAAVILGNFEATVTGHIERTPLGLDRYQPRLGEMIRTHLESGPQTMIPIRDGVPEAPLGAALRDLPL